MSAGAPDVGTGIPHPSRSLVRPPVDERMQPTPPDASLGAAGADETEADTPQRVTPYPAVVDTQLHGSYGDAVTRQGLSLRLHGLPTRAEAEEIVAREVAAGRVFEGDYLECDDGSRVYAPIDEHAQQSRLSRWQAQR